MLRITLKKSPIGRPEKHRRIVQSLGLRKLNQTVEKPETDIIKGMVNKIPHLLEVEQVQ